MTRVMSHYWYRMNFTEQQLHAEDILITLQRTMLMSPCLHTPQKTNKSVSKMIQYVQCSN
jgi:hypothetical protein